MKLDLQRKYKRVTFIMLEIKESYYEYPTLAILHHHSHHMHPRAKVLYMHTKGSTNPGDENRHHLFLSMLHFNVGLYNQSLGLLDAGWDTSGFRLLKNHGWPTHYSGNFWWASAEKLTHTVSPMELVWYWRYASY